MRAFVGLFGVGGGGGGGRECKQTCRKAKWNVSAGLKQLKVAKGKVELKKKAEGIDSLPWSENHRKKRLVLVFYKMPDQGSS